MDASILGPVVPHAERMGVVNNTKLAEMKGFIESLGPAELMRYVEAAYAALRVPGVMDMTPAEYMQSFGPLLGFSFDKYYELAPLAEYFEYNMSELQFVQRAMADHQMFAPDAEKKFPGVGDTWRMHRNATRLMHYFNKAVLCWARCKCFSDDIENASEYNPETLACNVGERGVSLRFEEDVKMFEHHELLLYMLDVAHERGYRKFGNYVFDRVKVYDAGKRLLLTHAWEEVMDMEQFIRRACPKELNIKMWRAANMRSSSVADCAKALACAVDPELPTLDKDRNVFAFDNGTYVVWREHEDGSITDLFVPYELPPGRKPLSSHIVAANFFRQPLEYMGGRPWPDIPTPNLDKILDTQRFPDEVKRWMYVFIGRLLHELGLRDGWQVVPFLKGLGGSGKSTIINDVVGIVYNKLDVGVLSNNCERRFGLSGIADKLVFLAPEIKEDLQLEQAEFQSIISGEEVQINKKHETAKSMRWTTPGIMGGNELPGWIDNSGSITRRVVVFFFGTFVDRGDMHLRTKLRGEIGYIIQKCARAYIEAVAEVGSDNVWSHLPEYFKEQQRQLLVDANSVEHFLTQHICVFGPEHYMPVNEFHQEYLRFCKDNALKSKALKRDSLATSFARYNIVHEATNATRIYPPGSGVPSTCVYLVGIAFRGSGGGEADDEHGC
ncbi:hypothetical protein COO60DRAFT_1643842 [Scenedesmus sp. NREL 46B-D3]|nr:hypothetical protein COO60DRAFT_1643842 [Scenedesmus sp. NREL 46B-D3]